MEYTEILQAIVCQKLTHSSMDFCAIFSGKNPGIMMGNRKNPLASVELTLSLNAQTAWYLDRLIEKGLYGNGRAEAAKIALFDHCKLLIAQGELQRAPALPGSDAIPIPDGTS